MMPREKQPAPLCAQRVGPFRIPLQNIRRVPWDGPGQAERIGSTDCPRRETVLYLSRQIGIGGGAIVLILIAVLFMICGILLLQKAKRMPKEQGLHVITGIGAVVFIVLGMILAYYLLSGEIAWSGY